MQKIISFFLFASGADRTLLAKCPTDKSKYVGIGATIFFTGLFAALAAAYALFTVFNSYIIASILGFIWGLMIFNLDRYIVSSMRKDSKMIREFGRATPRIILAIGISLIIAKPLELKIFEKEIESELALMEQQDFAKKELEVKQRYQPEINALKLEIDKLQSDRAARTEHRDQLIKAAQQEADGTGGSKQKNLGPIYKVKKADADKAIEEVEKLSISTAHKINGIEKNIDKKDSLLTADLLALTKNKLDGPASRLEALNRLTNQSSAIWWANLFIILLFVFIETAPILVKLISKSGPYDALLHAEEHKFIVSEIETIAVATHETKKRNELLGNSEHTYLTRKLDAELL